MNLDELFNYYFPYQGTMSNELINEIKKYGNKVIEEIVGTPMTLEQAKMTFNRFFKEWKEMRKKLGIPQRIHEAFLKLAEKEGFNRD